MDTSEHGSSSYAQQQQHQHCLRHRNAGVAAGGGSSSSGAADAAGPEVAANVADAKEEGVAGMAFKESKQEVRWLAAACCTCRDAVHH
jgi:mevalonate pyrophosphate decarboxylase